MTTMLALVLAYNPQLIYSTGFQLSVAAVFGILLLTKPLKSLVERTLLRPFARPPGQISNLISVSLAGNVFPLLAYPLNACNGFLVAILVQTAQGASSLPFASVTTPGVSLLLVGLFYAGCIPPIVAEGVFSTKHSSLWAALLLVWSVLWLILVAAGHI